MSLPTAAPVSIDHDHRFMALALALGRRGLGDTWPNPAVGAVVVREVDGGPVIVGRGWTQPGGRPHAETEALRQAGEGARGATLYVTLEPCSHHGKTPPCCDAIVAAGITRVVSAIEDPNPLVAGRGHTRLREAGIAVECGLGSAEARCAHAGHLRRVRDGRPHVTLKIALSADHKVAAAGRRPVAITGEAASAHVHMMRAMNDAILIGVGTALADDPLLTCRLPGMVARSPVRVVLDSTLRLRPGGRLVGGPDARQSAPVWVVTGPQASPAAAADLASAGCDVVRVDTGVGGVDLAAAMTALGARGITRLLVEAGPILAASLVTHDLVDEAVLIEGGVMIGPDGLDPFHGLAMTALTGSPRFVRVRSVTAGTDRVTTFIRSSAT